MKAVHPKPVNLLIGASGLSVAEAADLGVRRISVGGSLARAAWAGFMRAAREIAEQGTFTELGQGLSRRRTEQDVQLTRRQHDSAADNPARCALLLESSTRY